jgi:hypothetical protein
MANGAHFSVRLVAPASVLSSAAQRVTQALVRSLEQASGPSPERWLVHRSMTLRLETALKLPRN